MDGGEGVDVVHRRQHQHVLGPLHRPPLLHHRGAEDLVTQSGQGAHDDLRCPRRPAAADAVHPLGHHIGELGHLGVDRAADPRQVGLAEVDPGGDDLPQLVQLPGREVPTDRDRRGPELPAGEGGHHELRGSSATRGPAGHRGRGPGPPAHRRAGSTAGPSRRWSPPARHRPARRGCRPERRAPRPPTPAGAGRSSPVPPPRSPRSSSSAQLPLDPLAGGEAVLAGLERGGVGADAGEEVGHGHALGAGHLVGRPERPHGALDDQRR